MQLPIHLTFLFYIPFHRRNKTLLTTLPATLKALFRWFNILNLQNDDPQIASNNTADQMTSQPTFPTYHVIRTFQLYYSDKGNPFGLFWFRPFTSGRHEQPDNPNARWPVILPYYEKSTRKKRPCGTKTGNVFPNHCDATNLPGFKGFLATKQ